MNITFIRLVHNAVYFSQRAVKNLRPNVSMFTAPGLVAVVRDSNGLYSFAKQYANITPAIHSAALTRFLIHHLGRSGRISAKYYSIRGFQSPVLIIADSLPDEPTIQKIDLLPVEVPVSLRLPHVTITKAAIHFYPFRPEFCGPVRLLRRGDVLALIPEQDGFIQYRQTSYTYGIIYSQYYVNELTPTASYYPWTWERNGCFFFTTNLKQYRRISSIDGFIPVMRSKRRLPKDSMTMIRANKRILSFPSRDARQICGSEYFTLFESGPFCMLAPDPNGLYRPRFIQNQTGYHIAHAKLCQYLLEKFNGEQLYHSKVTRYGLVFSNGRVDKIPARRSFRSVPDLKTVERILVVDTPNVKKLVLPFLATSLLTQWVSIRRFGSIWAILADENGPFRLRKKKKTIHCADLIPKIRASLRCGPETLLPSRRDGGVLYFSNVPLRGTLPDLSRFKPVE